MIRRPEGEISTHPHLLSGEAREKWWKIGGNRTFAGTLSGLSVYLPRVDLRNFPFFTLVSLAGRSFLSGKPSLFFLVLLVHTVIAADVFTLDSRILEEAETRYGAAARSRLLSWQQLIRDDKSVTDLEKLQKVNRFFNKMQFVSDAIHWNKIDYWATPVEFLASDAGDCEDFSLAKYFTLKILGVAEAKINLTYVKAWKIGQAHMVLTYYETPGSEPLVLDNIIDEIQPASMRDDLLPVFSFNGTGLWISKQRERGKLVGTSDRLSLWKDFLSRMPEGIK